MVAVLLAPLPSDRPRSATAARELLATAFPAAEAASPVRVDDRRACSSQSHAARRAVRGAAIGRTNGRPGRTAWPRRRLLLSSRSSAIAWLGGRDRLGLFDPGPSDLGAISSITPLSAESADVVPTQYHWRLHNGVLTGRLDVSNPTSVATPATAMPELFPASASTDGTLRARRLRWIEGTAKGRLHAGSFRRAAARPARASHRVVPTQAG